VFLANPVRRAISLIARPSRYLILRTFAYITMVCTSSPAEWKTPQARSEHPGQFSVSRSLFNWSIFNARQHLQVFTPIPNRLGANPDEWDSRARPPIAFQERDTDAENPRGFAGLEKGLVHRCFPRLTCVERSIG
jgi:hypothetical protein